MCSQTSAQSGTPDCPVVHRTVFGAPGWSPLKVLVGVSTPVGGGVPGPTSKLSLRVPAQMGRRETEHKGGKTVRGNRGLRVVLRPGRMRLQ
jgi:hypothetical protein